MDLGSPETRSAPYGQSCTNCVRVKCRCVLRAGSDICERCRRLNKNCLPSTSVRKRKARANKTSQTAHLETKLDQLVTLLQSKSDDGPRPDHVLSSATPATTGSSNSEASASNDYHYHHTSTTNSLTPSSDWSVGSSCSSTRFLDAEPSPAQAESLFQYFRTKKLPHFPYTRFPDVMTAAQLRQDCPFFWLCIMAVTSTSVQQQLSLGRRVREIAAQAIIVDGERSLDLLLGVICFLAWGQALIHKGPFLTGFSTMAITLLLDMELHRPSRSDTRVSMSTFPKPQIVNVGSSIPTTRTMEHRRLVLATYFVCSIFGCWSQRPTDGLPWTPYMEQCLQTLQESPESPSDVYLAQQIKIQRITDKANQISLLLRDAERPQDTHRTGFCIENLRAQLADVTSQIPAYMAGNAELRLHCLFTEAVIYDIASVRTPFIPPSSDPDVRILDSLFAAVEEAKAWFELFLKQDITQILCSSVTMTKHFPRILYLFDRLTRLDDPTWDTNFVHQKVNVRQFLEDLEAKLQRLADSIDFTPKSPQDESIATRALRTIQLKKHWADCNQKPSTQGESSDASEMPSAGDVNIGLHRWGISGFMRIMSRVYHGIGSLSADPSSVWDVAVGSIL